MLPDSSYVPFAARRLKHARVLYVQPGLSERPDWAHRFGWMVADGVPRPEALGAEQKEFQAERYGGTGIGLHGGGARCGIDGAYLVKGIGTNPLLGRNARETDFWHAHGHEPVAGALQEAAWGEVFHHALPWGAVRVSAILWSGMPCWFPGDHGQRRQVPGALSVRPHVVRPAHFIRATHFRPGPDAHLPADAARVRAAIERLADCLPAPADLAGAVGAHAMAPSDRLHAGLFELIRRLAQQCAAAQSKRLLHGGLSASNLAIDGRWLDFGTASAMPHYANTKCFGQPAHFPTFWEEQERLSAIIQRLAFFCRKYHPAGDAAGSPDDAELVGYFAACYEEELSRAFVRLCGFSDVLLAPSWGESCIGHLSNALLAIALDGVSKRFAPAQLDLELLGPNRLAALLLTLAAHGDDADCAARLAALGGHTAQVERAWLAYRAVGVLAAQAAQRAGCSTQGLRRLRILRAARSGRTMRVLYRHAMARQCAELVTRNATPVALARAAQGWLGEISEHARLVYGHEKDDEFLCFQRGERRIWFDARRDLFRVETGAATRVLPAPAIHQAAALADARNFWGDEVWSVW